MDAQSHKTLMLLNEEVNCLTNVQVTSPDKHSGVVINGEFTLTDVMKQQLAYAEGIAELIESSKPQHIDVKHEKIRFNDLREVEEID